MTILNRVLPVLMLTLSAFAFSSMPTIKGKAKAPKRIPTSAWTRKQMESGNDTPRFHLKTTAKKSESKNKLSATAAAPKGGDSKQK